MRGRERGVLLVKVAFVTAQRHQGEFHDMETSTDEGVPVERSASL
jgi:hypothetical protein